MTKSCCHVTSRKKGRQSKGRRHSKGRASKGRRPSRHTHNLGGGGTDSYTGAPSKKGDNWTRAQRALLYGVGAAGTGALTGALLGPVHYTKSDLKQGGVLYNEFEAYVRNQYSNGTFTSDDDEQLKFLRVKNQYRNEKVGAGLAAAAAATYGASRSLKADSPPKPSAAKRARRAVLYGVGAAGTGLFTGAYLGAKFNDQEKKPRTNLGMRLGAGLGAAAAGAYGALRDD
jgi:hypothetical protein